MIPQLALEAFLALLSVKQNFLKQIFMMSVSTVIYFTDQQIQILTSRPGRPGIPAGPLNPGGPAVSFIKKKSIHVRVMDVKMFKFGTDAKIQSS